MSLTDGVGKNMSGCLKGRSGHLSGDVRLLLLISSYKPAVTAEVRQKYMLEN